MIIAPPKFKTLRKKTRKQSKVEEIVIIDEPVLNKIEPNEQDITNVRKLLCVDIENPQINVLNEDSFSQMLIIGGSAKIELNEEILPYDSLEIDTKRSIYICLESMETFVAPGIIDMNKPVL